MNTKPFRTLTTVTYATKNGEPHPVYSCNDPQGLSKVITLLKERGIPFEKEEEEVVRSMGSFTDRHSGNLWCRELKERPIGEIFRVLFYGSGKFFIAGDEDEEKKMKLFAEEHGGEIREFRRWELLPKVLEGESGAWNSCMHFLERYPDDRSRNTQKEAGEWDAIHTDLENENNREIIKIIAEIAEEISHSSSKAASKPLPETGPN